MGDLGYGSVAKFPDIYPIFAANSSQLNVYGLFRGFDETQTIPVRGQTIFEMSLGIAAHQIEIHPEVGPI